MEKPYQRAWKMSQTVGVQNNFWGGCHSRSYPPPPCFSFPMARPYPQYGWAFPDEIPEKFWKASGNALRAFPGIPLRVRLGSSKPYYSRLLSISRLLFPSSTVGDASFFQKCFRGPLRAGQGFPGVLRVLTSRATHPRVP